MPVHVSIGRTVPSTFLRPATDLECFQLDNDSDDV